MTASPEGVKRYTWDDVYDGEIDVVFVLASAYDQLAAENARLRDLLCGAPELMESARDTPGDIWDQIDPAIDDWCVRARAALAEKP